MSLVVCIEAHYRAECLSIATCVVNLKLGTEIITWARDQMTNIGILHSSATAETRRPVLWTIHLIPGHRDNQCFGEGFPGHLGMGIVMEKDTFKRSKSWLCWLMVQVAAGAGNKPSRSLRKPLLGYFWAFSTKIMPSTGQGKSKGLPHYCITSRRIISGAGGSRAAAAVDVDVCNY